MTTQVLATPTLSTAPPERQTFRVWLRARFRPRELSREEVLALWESQKLKAELKRAREAAVLNLIAGRPF